MSLQPGFRVRVRVMKQFSPPVFQHDGAMTGCRGQRAIVQQVLRILKEF